MAKSKVFVDGSEGTTGLKIRDYLSCRKDIKLLEIDSEKRKVQADRKEIMNEADIVFLCLPDTAAKEAVSLIENDHTKVIDSSTAHRINPEWAYGIPELSSEHRERIKHSKRVSVAGCYATGFNIIAYPLIHQGILPRDYPMTCHAVSGYSGGGKKLINTYENSESKQCYNSPGFYALNLQHKHMAEMKNVSGLSHPVIFSPIVGKYYNGMTVAIPLHTRFLKGQWGAKDLHTFLSSYYKEASFINVMPFDIDQTLDEGFLRAEGCNGTNRLEIYIFGDDDRTLICSRLDNLGKGASGAAVQNMNIMLDINETTGLFNK